MSGFLFSSGGSGNGKVAAEPVPAPPSSVEAMFTQIMAAVHKQVRPVPRCLLLEPP